MKEWASALWVDEHGRFGVHDGNDRLMTVRTAVDELDDRGDEAPRSGVGHALAEHRRGRL